LPVLIRARLSADRRTALTLPNGVTLAYSYDQDSRVTGMTWTSGTTQVGNLFYSYDADGRVTAKSGSFAQTNLPQAVTGNSFNAANEMTGFNGAALSYDLNGNLTADGTNSYSWDARNHLASISGGTTASFVYDAFGRRMSKNVNGSITQFLYDGLNPVQELDGANPANVTANLLTGLNIDEYFTRADSNGAMNFISDALGSTLALTDSSGAINTSYTYEPFGNTTIGGSNPNPYQFTGRENDGTGLYFYRARYYSSTFQRLIAQDPLDFRSGASDLYVYVQNSPVNATDPLGLFDLIGCLEYRIFVAPKVAKAGRSCQDELNKCQGGWDIECLENFMEKYHCAFVGDAMMECTCEHLTPELCAEFKTGYMKCSELE